MAQASLFKTLKEHVLVWSIILLLFLIMVLYGANQAEFREPWTSYVEGILDKKNISIDIESLQYSTSNGITFGGVTFHASDDKSTLHMNASSLSVKLNYRLKPREITIQEGKLWVELKDDSTSKFEISDIYSRISIPKRATILIPHTTAKIQNLPVTLSAEVLLGFGSKSKKYSTSSYEYKTPKFLKTLCQHLSQVHCYTPSSSQFQIDLKHNGRVKNGLNIDFQLSSEGGSYNHLQIEQIKTKARYANHCVSIMSLHLKDDTGALNGKGAYNLQSKRFDYSAVSNLNLPRILRHFEVKSFADQMSSPFPPEIDAQGSLTYKKDLQKTSSWDFKIHGQLKAFEFNLLGSHFDSLHTDFSWRNHKLFLRSMRVEHAQGTLEGDLLMTKETIRYKVKSDLPIDLYKPFLKKKGILAETINKVWFTENSSIQAKLEGSMLREQINNWEAFGKVHVEQIAYNKVPIVEANCSFTITPIISEFNDIEAVFDYSEYQASPYSQDRPLDGILLGKKVSYNVDTQIVSVEELHGKAWIAPILNLFAPSVGKFLDQTIQTSIPPSFTSNGTIGIKENSQKTNLRNEILEPLSIQYELLGKTITFNEADAQVQLLGTKTLLNNIETQVLGGSLKGSLSVENQKPKGAYSTNLAFTRLSLTKIADKYDFKTTTPGNLTGNVILDGLPNEVRSLQGKGFIALDQADLFHIPVFGPLSPIMSGILGHKKTSHEKVRHLSSSFRLFNGALYTNDLSSITPSAKISGHGVIDLDTQLMDITVKTSTKGLAGLLTLPLKPLEKFLQFRGTGSITKPKWSYSPLDSTPSYLKPSNFINRAILID